MTKPKESSRKKFVPLKKIRLDKAQYHLPGAYAITICTHRRQWLFNIPELRAILYEEWENLPQHFVNITPAVLIVMHDHLHCILIIEGEEKNIKSVSQIIGGYKSLVTNAWVQYLKETNANYPGKIWQYRFYDHVIRSDADYKAQHAYILNNPAAFEAKNKQNNKNEPT